MKLLQRFLMIGLLLLAKWTYAEVAYPLDKAPDRSNDLVALQRGAKLFVNYCLNCHAAAFVRYNTLERIGIPAPLIEKNLLFTRDKVSDLMTISMRPYDAKTWFGVQPPDLSLIARSRSSGAGSGADYLYTFLRTFYRDPEKSHGWNNLVFPDVAMPNPLWELQGQRRAEFKSVADAHKPQVSTEQFTRFEPLTQGTMTEQEFDNAAADLVGFLEWISNPGDDQFRRTGLWVLAFMVLMIFVTWRLNAAYWKDVT